MLILLVDDDPEFAATVRDYLTGKNHEVTIASDGRMMRAELEVSKFDIVLLDLCCPGTSISNNSMLGLVGIGSWYQTGQACAHLRLG